MCDVSDSKTSKDEYINLIIRWKSKTTQCSSWRERYQTLKYLTLRGQDFSSLLYIIPKFLPLSCLQCFTAANVCGAAVMKTDLSDTEQIWLSQPHQFPCYHLASARRWELVDITTRNIYMLILLRSKTQVLCPWGFYWVFFFKPWDRLHTLIILTTNY